MRPTDLVLSYGDVIRPSGYRTRILGEFRRLEQPSALEPYLLALDRDADRLRQERPADVAATYRTRHAAWFLPELRRISRSRDVRLVHAHNLYSCALALTARGYGGYRVVLDLHGRIPEEFVYLGKGGSGAKRLLERLEAWTVRRADHVVAVSHRLREYLVDRYDLDQSRVSVIPDCADPAFRRDPEQRRAFRARMGLADRFVCIHLGSFQEWYRPEAVLEAFEAVRRRIREAHLAVVTFDPAGAGRFLESKLRPEDYTVTRASHDEVPALLNAADLGFLLLPRTPNIRTSSPTKFSEYLNCGLPVLISPEVGDFSELVAREGVGWVLDDSGAGPDPDFLDTVAGQRTEIARRCARAGEALRWEAYAEVWTGILGRVGVLEESRLATL